MVISTKPKVTASAKYTSKYSKIIDWLEKGDYSSAINEIERIQEEERLAELAKKGIVEIEITLDNWEQYFEYTPCAYAYITNAFGEPTAYNFCGGIKLKDEYAKAEKGGRQECQTPHRTCRWPLCAEDYPLS